MMSLPSPPLRCIPTNNADHGIRRRVPYETSDTRRLGRQNQICAPRVGAIAADLRERTLISTTAHTEACRSALLSTLLTR
jgi:hypothetical protein